VIEEIKTFLAFVGLAHLFMWSFRHLWDKYLTKYLLILVMDSDIQLGKLAPWVFGLAMGRFPHKVKREN